jgi:hypothetical protein
MENLKKEFLVMEEATANPIYYNTPKKERLCSWKNLTQFMKHTKKRGLGHKRSEPNCKTTHTHTHTQNKRGFGQTRS